MAHDRYDNRTRRGSRTDYDPSSPRSFGRNDGRAYMRGSDYDRSGYDRDERDFFDRARDEVMSWFGDERAERRRRMDERYDDWDERRERSTRPVGFTRSYDNDRYDRRDLYDYDRAYTQDRFDRGLTQSETTGRGVFDDDYSTWRRRQIDELDRDYREWRSENARRFDDEFTNWRNERMTKREMMRSIEPHSEVVDCDGNHVGTIDRVVGDRMILTRMDSEDGHHHSLSCRHLDCLVDGKVQLNLTAEKAKEEWRDEDRSRALGEEFEGDEGPHILNRSFSHTY